MTLTVVVTVTMAMTVSVNMTLTVKGKVTMINLYSIFDFFINYENLTLKGCSMIVNSETDKILGVVLRASFP